TGRRVSVELRAGRSAAGQRADGGGKIGRAVAGRGFDPGRNPGCRLGPGGGGGGDAAVLQAQRRQRGAGAAVEHGDPAGGDFLFSCRAHPAGDRGRDSDDWYGGGFERADFRENPRGTAGRQGGGG